MCLSCTCTTQVWSLTSPIVTWSLLCISTEHRAKNKQLALLVLAFKPKENRVEPNSFSKADFCIQFKGFVCYLYYHQYYFPQNIKIHTSTSNVSSILFLTIRGCYQMFQHLPVWCVKNVSLCSFTFTCFISESKYLFKC